MEKSKPAQNHEQPTPEYDVVKTFPADLDVTIRPLTVIRSGKDGGGIRHDGGWTPGDMLCVCKEGTGSIELFVKVHKPIKVYGEHVYEECVPVTKIVSLKKLQSREANKGFNESYIQELYGKSTEEMIEEGERAAKQISNSSVVEEDSPNFERPKVSLKIGSTAVEAAGVRKPVETNKVDTSEPVREPVKKDKADAGSSALVMTKEVLASIGAIKVNAPADLPAVEPAKKPSETDKVGTNPADLMATEPVKKPVEADKASADLVDLPAAKSVENPVVEKSMETNEASTDILPESFKDAINRFKQLTEENNGEFFEKAKYITGELDQLRQQIQRNPGVIYGLNSEEFMKGVSNEITALEASRSESVNKFKNDINSLLEGLKSEIENEDEKRRRLVKLTKHVDQMGVNNTVLGEVTNGLLDKLIRIRSYIAESQNSRWGIDHYKSNITQVIDEIINDLSIASGHRRNIVGGIKGIESEGYHQKR